MILNVTETEVCCLLNATGRLRHFATSSNNYDSIIQENSTLELWNQIGVEEFGRFNAGGSRYCGARTSVIGGPCNRQVCRWLNLQHHRGGNPRNWGRGAGNVSGAGVAIVDSKASRDSQRSSFAYTRLCSVSILLLSANTILDYI